MVKRNNNIYSLKKIAKAISIMFALAFCITPLSSQSRKDSCFLYYEKADKAYMDLDKCLQLSIIATKFCKQSQQWENVVNGLNSIYYCEYNLGNFDNAHRAILEAIDTSKVHLSANNIAYNNAKSNLGIYYGEMGNYDKALELFLDSAEKISSNENKDDPEQLKYLSQNYNTIAILNRRKGDYNEALRYYLKSSEIRKTIYALDHHKRINSHYSLARAYMEKGDLDEAYSYSEKYIKELKKHYSNFPNVENNLLNAYNLNGQILLKQNQYNKAKEIFNHAILLNPENKGNFKHTSYKQLSNIYLAEGNYSESKELLETALDLAKKRIGDKNTHLSYSPIYKSLGNVEFKLNNVNEAIAHYQTALKNISHNYENLTQFDNPALDQIFDDVTALDVLESKAEVISSVDKTEALVVYELYLQVSNRLKKTLPFESSKLITAGKIQTTINKAIECAIDCYKNSNDQEFLFKALQFIEHKKSSLLTNKLELKNKQSDSAENNLLNQENELSKKIAFYNRRLSETDPSVNSEKHQLWSDHLFNLKEQLVRLKRRINESQKDKLLGNLDKFETSKELLSAIDQEQIVTNYTFIDSTLYAFILSNEKIGIKEIGNRNQCNDLIETLKDFLWSPDLFINDWEQSQNEFGKYSHDFYSLLKMDEIIQEYNPTSFVIIPDDILWSIPFEIMSSSFATEIENMPFLFNKYSFSYSHNLSILLGKQEQKKKPYKFAGFAPAFGSKKTEQRSCNSNVLGKLDNENEIQNIFTTLNSGDLFIGSSASVDNFNNICDQYDIIHLATHACIFEQDPNLSKIFFNDDEYMTLYELSNLNLDNSMTVLSACETSRGEFYSGEGVMNIARGFSFSGSRSIVTSMWKADDLSTQKLMVLFYKHLKHGLKKDHALRQSKIDFIKNAKITELPPYYWANFIVLGEATELYYNSMYWDKFKVVIPILLVLFAIIFFIKKFK